MYVHVIIKSMHIQKSDNVAALYCQSATEISDGSSIECVVIYCSPHFSSLATNIKPMPEHHTI